jgi:thioredoxin 1
MQTSMRILTAAFLALGMVVGVAAQETPTQGGGAATNVPVKIKFPRLVDLGADKCIPCKLMAPILSKLKSEQAGWLEVEFIDVWKSPEAAKPYKISLIPTQIFYDATGKELFRHEGFYSKEDIMAKWKELGVKLQRAK